MSEKNNTIQHKLNELSQLVAWFQGSDFTLEEALTTFKKAEKLADEIDADLTKLKNDIVVVQQRFDRET